MQKYCPYCGGTIISEESNFCADCGQQLRELSPEDAAIVPPEDQRQIPMPVVMKVVPICPKDSLEETREAKNVESIFRS